MEPFIEKKPKQRWNFSKALFISISVHALALFGIGFIIFSIQDQFDSQRIVNIKFANANVDSLGSISSKQDLNNQIVDVRSDTASISPDKSSESLSIKRLDANSSNSDSEARYLNAWQRRIETMGHYELANSNIKQDASLTVRVIIDSSGELIISEILESSRNDFIDQLALRILKESSPFMPFNEEMTNAYKQIEVVRVWNFKK